MQNIFIQKNVQLASGGTPATKTVEIDTKSVTESGKKKVPAVIVQPTTKGGTGLWGDGLPKTPRLPDLLMIEDSIVVKGELKTDDERRATLNETLAADDQTITIANQRSLDTAGSLKPSYIQIDDEVIQYTGISGNDLTGCTRGWGGTTAATHSSGTSVFHPAYHYKKILQYIIREGGTCTVFYATGSAVFDPNFYSPSTSGTAVSMDGSFANMPQFTGQITRWSFGDVPERINALSNTISVDLTIQLGVNL